MSEIIEAWARYHGFREANHALNSGIWMWVSPWDPRPPFDSIRGRAYVTSDVIISLCKRQMQNL